MWRIGIAGIVLLWGAIAGGLIASEVTGGERSPSHQVAARQLPDVASDVDTAVGAIGLSDRVALAQGVRDQLRRELFGAAASGGQPREADAAVRDRGVGAGATGDIPASMTASLPPPVDDAAVEAPRPAAATPPALANGAPLQVSPAPPRPRADPVNRALPAARDAAGARVKEAPPLPAAKGRMGDPKVAEAQRLLAIIGYAPGAADGRAGRQTTAAVLAYERAAGLPADGRIDAAMLTRLRKDMRSPQARTAPVPSAATKAGAGSPSLTERVLGGMQRLIGRDLDSVRAPAQLAEYCASRGDEWIYDRGQGRMRLCGDINGGGRIAYRPLPGDR